MNNPTVKQQAEKYVALAGVKAARRSVHYATASICRCGTCFCCEVANAVKAAEGKAVAKGDL